MGVTAREVIFRIIGHNDEFVKAVNESKDRLDAFEKKTKDADKIFSEVARNATIASAAIAGIGIACGKMAVDFNAGFAKVQTLIPGASDRIKELQKNVLDLSPAVGKSTQDLTDGLYQVISAYGDSAEAAAQLETTAKAAAAGGTTTTEALNLISAVTKGYGDTSAAAQKKVSDLAFVTVKIGQTDFPQMATAIQRVTALSNTLSISQEEMFSIFAAGTGVIGGAAEVSTKLAATYNELLKPQEDLQTAFKALGVASGNELIKKFGGLQNSLGALRAYADQTGIPINRLFRSMEAGQIALFATDTGAAACKRALVELGNASGATEEAFSAATSGGVNKFGFQLQQTKLNAQAFAIKLGQELIPSVQSLLGPVFKLLDGLKNLNEDQLHLIIAIGKTVLAFTGMTAAVFGFAKGVIGVKKALDTMNGAFQIIGLTNPFVAAVAGAVAAIVVIKELCAWFDRAAEKQFKARMAAIDANAAFFAQAQGLSELAKQYATYAAKQKLTQQESLKMAEVAKKIAELTSDPKSGSGPDEIPLDEKTGKSNLDIGAAVSGAHTVAERAKEQMAANKQRIAMLTEFEAALEKHIEKVESGFGKVAEAERAGLINPDTHKAAAGTRTELERTREEILKLKKTLEETERGIAALKDFDTGAFTPESASGQAPGLDIEGNTNEKTHTGRLAALDIEYQAEQKILENYHAKKLISDEAYAAAAAEAEAAHYEKRKALLETFIKENIAAGQSFAQATSEIVAAGNRDIEDETTSVNKKINALDDGQHKKKLTDIAQISEKTREHIAAELELKRQLGQLAGATPKEQERTYHLEMQKGLLAKQNELQAEYIKLIESGTAKDREKAAALKQEIEELGKAAVDEGKAAENALVKSLQKVSEELQKLGSVFTDMFSGLADVARDVIGAKNTERERQTAAELTQIERDKNATLLEIDDELSDMREQKQIADAERDAAFREEEYQKKIAEYDRSLAELEGAFAMETNIAKIKDQEKQIEAERKKKLEEQKRKKEEDEKKKREKEERAREVELLNARNEAEYTYALAKVQIENEAGSASAKAAQQAAQWQKAQTATSLIVKAAEQIALAAIAFARVPSGDVSGAIEGAMRTAAAAISFVQAGVVGAAPLPPDYVTQPLPSAPKPIKFAAGAIALPRPGGTGITLPNGYPGIVAEAGVAEMILPLTAPNIEKMFAAAGLRNTTHQSSQFSYAPSIGISVTHTVGEDLGEQVIRALEDHEREVFNIVSRSRQNWYVGA